MELRMYTQDGEQMENLNVDTKGKAFHLTALPDGLSEQFMDAVLEDMDDPQPKRPL